MIFSDYDERADTCYNYLDTSAPTTGAEAIGSYPAAAAPANGVSLAAALKWATDALTGANGVPTYPAAAAPANGVSLAEVLRAVFNLLQPVSVAGSATVTDASQTESTPFALITIAPAAGAPLADVDVILDLAKASTGFGAVETSITVQAALSRKIDGTNWRREAYVEAALSGTNAALRAMLLRAGSVGVTEQVRVELVFSADVTSNLVIPYLVTYKGIAAPTIS